MRLRHLGIIGAGSITTELLEVLGRSLELPLERISVLVRPGKVDAALVLKKFATKATPNFVIMDNFQSFLESVPDLVIECAGHSAVHDYICALLENGIETVIASTGALSDEALYHKLKTAALEGDTRLILPAGAVGGMDILAALKNSDITSVTYTSRKPPNAWAGTKAEQTLDLKSIDQQTAFFEGSAREAATDYPKNANVAATIALAGIGFENTAVRMIADPGVQANIHVFDIVSNAAEVSVRIEGKPSPRNPKTSLPTVYSLVREVVRRVEPIIS